MNGKGDRVMQKTTIEYYCDICKTKVSNLITINYPVLFTTEQDEGRSVNTPYVSQERLEICSECKNKIIKLRASGCQGYNQYTIVGEK